jgi:hypothetical protein
VWRLFRLDSGGADAERPRGAVYFRQPDGNRPSSQRSVLADYLSAQARGGAPPIENKILFVLSSCHGAAAVWITPCPLGKLEDERAKRLSQNCLIRTIYA